MKKALLLLLSVTFAFAGCDSLSGGDFDYSTFSSLIANPDSPSTMVDSNVELVGIILSERFEQEGKEYVMAGISRSDDAFYLEVTDVEEEFEIFDVVTIDGKVADIYYSAVIDNSEVNYAVVIAKSIKEKKTDDSGASKDKCVNVNGDVEYSFSEVGIGSDVFGEKLFVLYYDAKGLEANAVVSLDGIYVMQDDTVLGKTAHEPENLRGDALSNSTLNTLNKGDEQLYYTVYKTATDSNSLVIEGYDDEFNLTCKIDLTAK